MPRLQRGFGRQRRVSTDCRSVGILSRQGVAGLFVGRQSERDHDTDRQGTVAGRQRRRDRLLRKRQRPLPAAIERRSGAHQARQATRDDRGCGEGTSVLQQLPRTGRRRRTPGDSLPCGAIRTLHRFPIDDVAARISQQQSRCNGGYRQAPRRTRYCGTRRLLPTGRRLRSGGDATNQVIAMAEEPQSLSRSSAAPAGGPVSAEDAAQALRDGPIGAYLVASIAVGLLFFGWLAFYFLVFLPRGAIG